MIEKILCLLIFVFVFIFLISRKKKIVNTTSEYANLFKDYNLKPKSSAETILIFDYDYFKEFKLLGDVYENDKLKSLIMDVFSQDCSIKQIYLNVLPDIKIPEGSILPLLNKFKNVWSKMDIFFKHTLTPQVSASNTTIFKEKNNNVIVLKVLFSEKNKLFTYPNQLCEIISSTTHQSNSSLILKFKNNEFKIDDLYNF